MTGVLAGLDRSHEHIGNGMCVVTEFHDDKCRQARIHIWITHIDQRVFCMFPFPKKR